MSRVLVVDDQEVVCEVLSALLRREGMLVESCHDGPDAIDRLDAFARAGTPFDVAVVDKNLPGMSGLRVLETGKRNHPLIEFVVITGYASFESAVEALSLGAYDYLVKPFVDIKEVAAKLRRAADKAALARKHDALAKDLKDKNVQLESAIGELRRTRAQAIRAARLTALVDAASRIGHELKHPMASLRTRLSALATEPVVSREALDALSADLGRLELVVAEFLDFARPRRPERAPTDLVRLVEGVLAELEFQFAQRGIEVTCDLAESASLSLDARQIGQVVRNLLINAAEAAPPSGRIHVRVIDGAREATLSVEDDGPGLPASSEELFTPFYTTKVSGTGLGLAICKKIVEEHSGRITLENRAARGARALVELPR